MNVFADTKEKALYAMDEADRAKKSVGTCDTYFRFLKTCTWRGLVQCKQKEKISL